MIIYVSKDDNQDYFKELRDQFEWEVFIEKEEETLLDFLRKQMQYIPTLSYMIIDREGIKEDETTLNETIETIKGMYGTKFIVLEKMSLDNEAAMKQKSNYISLYKKDKEVARYLEYLLKGNPVEEQEKITSNWIGVVSASAGAGCTDFAIGFANFIHTMEESVCYVDANETKALEQMAVFYGMEKVEDAHYKKDGLDYYDQSIDQSKEYVIFDIGKYTASKLSLLKQCKLICLIADGKPYRMEALKHVLAEIKNKNTVLCMNHTSQNDYIRLKELYLKEEKVDLIHYHTNLFVGDTNLYLQLLKEFHLLKEKKETIQKRLKNKRKFKKNNENLVDYSVENVDENVLYIEEEKLDNPKKNKQICQKIESNKKRKGKPLLLCFFLCSLLSMPFLLFDVKKSYEYKKPKTTTELMDHDLNIEDDIKISVLEVEGADGYEVSYSTEESFEDRTTVVVEVSAADRAIESLIAGKTYYVRVRAFKYNEDGKKVYGEYTKVQRIRT